MKNIFQNTGIILAMTLAGNCLPSEALQVVYPKSLNTEISADSTFFIGSTTPGSKLTINNKEVRVFENGSFVEVVPLNNGENHIEISSENENEHDALSYIIKKVPKCPKQSLEAELIEFPQNEYIYASVVKNNVPLRTLPDEDAKRLTHLGVDTVVMINGKQGDYYRVSLTPTENAWIKSENIVNYSTINSKMLATAGETTLSADSLYDYIKTPITSQVPFKISETETGLTLYLYNIKENASDTKVFETKGSIKSLTLNTVAIDEQSTYFIELNNKLWGYEAYYENQNLILKIRKPPEIIKENPLKNISIAIDAGHGGEDAGAIGPTGVKEKEINLDIAKKLEKLLKESNANVIMTRTEDCNTDLYARPKTAKENNALIMVSIHANALSDGGDPYEKHGTSVFYYNKESKELAETLRDTITQELGTKDDGTSSYSLVLTRPTLPLSVLIEIAYMIHPEEYKLLLDEEFRQKAAEAIKKGLEQYLLK